MARTPPPDPRPRPVLRGRRIAPVAAARRHWLSRQPLIVPVAAVGAAAMLIPALHASATGHAEIARHFFYGAILALIAIGMIGLAAAPGRRRTRAGAALLTVPLVMAGLPLMLAVPFLASLPDTGLFNAWWEMTSALTTTGASLYAADLLAPPLHLWRATVGWLGGLYVLIAAIAILAPLRVGGFEIMPSPWDRTEARARDGLAGAMTSRARRDPEDPAADPAHRAWRAAMAVTPVYVGLTLALWTVLMILGDPALLGLCRAMGTLSTSGISPVSGPTGAVAGIPGEAAVLLFLIPALSRRFWPGGGELRATERLRTDPELRMAALAVALVTALLFGRHFLAALGTDDGATPQQAGQAAWGTLFTALSFLTTTGWISIEWDAARAWSGLSSGSLVLAGLAIFGGGVATTAGGVKLLRVYALARHGERELERIIHPSSVGGGGRIARRLRREGAYLAFIFFMLFAISIAVTVVLVSIRPVPLETATILAIAALTNTGPLASAIPLIPTIEASAGLASAPWEGWSGLAPLTKGVLAAAMIVGRVETLAMLALFSPDFWRR